MFESCIFLLPATNMVSALGSKAMPMLKTVERTGHASDHAFKARFTTWYSTESGLLSIRFSCNLSRLENSGCLLPRAAYDQTGYTKTWSFQPI